MIFSELRGGPGKLARAADPGWLLHSSAPEPDLQETVLVLGNLIMAEGAPALRVLLRAAGPEEAELGDLRKLLLRDRERSGARNPGRKAGGHPPAPRLLQSGAKPPRLVRLTGTDLAAPVPDPAQVPASAGAKEPDPEEPESERRPEAVLT